MKDNKGQISAEYILLLVVIIVILMSISVTIIDQHEKNTIVASAKTGAQQAIDKNAYAMYYNDTFNNYQQEYPRLLEPTDIEIINITLTEDNETLKIQTTAHTHSKLNANERYIVGSRINYYIRKSITETFKQQQNDTFYNPALSENYQIYCEDVKWI